eukprot:673107-Pelagomonas_calceolata.AAC.9
MRTCDAQGYAPHSRALSFPMPASSIFETLHRTSGHHQLDRAANILAEDCVPPLTVAQGLYFAKPNFNQVHLGRSRQGNNKQARRNAWHEDGQPMGQGQVVPEL